MSESNDWSELQEVEDSFFHFSDNFKHSKLWKFIEFRNAKITNILKISTIWRIILSLFPRKEKHKENIFHTSEINGIPGTHNLR